MLNKDLHETFIREIEGTGSNTSTSSQSLNTNATSSDLATQHDTPQNRTDDLDKFMSSAQKNKSEGNSNSLTTGEATSNGESKSSEKTELISQGNIGVTSSAELLEKWRQVLIDIDVLMFNDLKSLFLLVY